MTTRIDINVSEFDAAGLRERAQQGVLANRRAQEERTQRIKTTKRAEKIATEFRFGADGVYSTASGGKYKPKGLPEEYVPRRNISGIGHTWLRPADNDSSIIETRVIGEVVNWLPAGNYLYVGETPDPYNSGFTLSVYKPSDPPFGSFYEAKFAYTVYKTTTRLDIRRSCIKDFLTQNGVNTIALQSQSEGGSQSTLTSSIILPAGRDAYYLIALLQTYTTSAVEVIKEFHSATGSMPSEPPSTGSNIQFRVDYTVNSSLDRENKMFKCNKTSALPINIPQKLTPVLNVLNPQPVSQNLSRFGYDAELVTVELPPDSPNAGSFVEATINSNEKQIPYESLIIPEPTGINNSTPEVFSLLNQLAVNNQLEPPISSSLLKTYEKSQLQLSKTTEQDEFTTFSFKKGDQELPRLQYRFPSEYRNGRSYYTIWDWDDPTYCRRILSTIGLG